MTHITGPRQRVVKRLARALLRAIIGSGATITESFEAIHETQMDMVHTMLRPWEDETCPTCPKQMEEEGRRIGRRRRR